MSLKKIDSTLVLAIACFAFLGYTVYSDRRPKPIDPQLKKGWIEVGNLIDKLKKADEVTELKRKLIQIDNFLLLNNPKYKNYGYLPRPQ